MQPLFPKGAVSFRPTQDTDRDFLKALYASTREWEFQITNWTPADKADFLEQQFKTQDLSYRMQFLSAQFLIIELDGVPIGRLYLDRQDDCLYIIEFTIAEAYRGRGIGTDILKSLLNEAWGGKVPARLSVHHGNPVMALYQRLGFRPIANTGTHYRMEWRPDLTPREI
ncbi:GNAT family N-acetyltransferase [Pacificoceanicola onchidii]|uniref:GNAT family N-acetyltransferase n=1 Tax=Pacificoceanicola onchidii TaxID=2562685 RepID=UPI0014560917|nr:GNAT family N-acetyltransferase [Pacificoceanicola onchidii]